MTEIGAEDDGTRAIVISAEIDSAAEQEEFQGLNVCRSAALSTLFGRDSIAVQQIAPEMRAMGFSEQLSLGAVNWPDITPEDLIPDGGSHQEAYRDGGIPDRVQLWQILNDTGSSRAAYPFLIAVLGSPLERESVAAAATLWRQLSKFQGSQTLDPGALFVLHSAYASWNWGQGFTPWLSVEPYADDLEVIPWNPQRWEDNYQKVMGQWRPVGENPKVWQGVFVLCRLAQLRLEIALRSQDVVTRSLARAVLLPEEGEGREMTGVIPSPESDRSIASPPMVSTMVHGTWGWKGDWWFPGGDFHSFIFHSHREDLYREGAPFSWSGAYSRSHREQAAIRFKSWVNTMAPQGRLHSVFGHSYGGEIVARAALNDTPVEQIVLLSTPVTRAVKTMVRVPGSKVVDIRLRFDPILALARTRQRIPSRSGVRTVLLDRWCLNHGATHEGHIWQAEDLASRSDL